MAGFKDSEIEAAVSTFVQSSPRIEQSALGPTDVDSKFQEVISLISSTLTYDPNAIFYVIYLATNRLNTLVLEAIEYLEDVEEAITEMGRRTTDVTKTELLGDAAAALLTVDQILTDKNAISSQAYSRYLTSVEEFTDTSLTPNVKSGGEIVRSPQLARSEVLTTLPLLSTAWADILERIAQIPEMLTEFLALKLGVVSIQDSVRQVREQLRTLQDYFEDTTTSRDDSIAKTREAYLDVTAGKSVLNNFTTVTDPQDPRLSSSSSISGSVADPAGDEGELTPAEITNTKSGPWEVVSGSADEFKVTADGGTEKTYTLTPPSQPSLTSFYHEDWDAFRTTPVAFNITTSNNKLEIDGLPVITLTTGANRTAANIVSDITSWITAGSYPYTASVEVSGSANYVKITKTTAGATSLRMTAEDVTDQAKILAAYDEIGFYEGQEDSSSGISAAEFAALINEDGYLEAEVERTLFEEDDDGDVTSTTVMELPLNTLSSLSHADDMLLIKSGTNAGYHRIVSTTRTATEDVVTVASATPFKAVASSQEYLIVRELVTLRSISTTTTSHLLIGTGIANTALGFIDSDEDVGQTTGFRATKSGTDIDFSRYDVVEDDVVKITDAGTTETTHTVLEVADSNKQLELDPPLDTDLTIASFTIYSAAAIAYEDFLTELELWETELSDSDYSDGIAELERAMNPLIANKNPSLAQINDAAAAASNMMVLLTNTSPQGLSEVLVAFQVAFVGRIDAALKMLKDRGMDRAYDQLLEGEVADFFGMDKDDASSSSFMLKSMRTVVQEDLPVSKLEEDADEVSHEDLVEDTDSDYDYSDADEDENLDVLGDVPDFDNEYDEESTRNTRF
jgi:hypothetical protein